LTVHGAKASPKATPASGSSAGDFRAISLIEEGWALESGLSEELASAGLRRMAIFPIVDSRHDEASKRATFVVVDFVAARASEGNRLHRRSTTRLQTIQSESIIEL
jgi:hypothetical protein